MAVSPFTVCISASRPAVFAAAAALLFSCGGPIPQPQLEGDAFQPSSASYIIDAGYDDVSSIYIEDVTARQLAMAATDNLDDADTSVDIVEEAGFFRVRVSGRETGSYRAPSHDRDSQAWAELTAKIIDSSRQGSSTLSKATSETLYSYVFTGMLRELDDYSRYAGRDEARENRASRDGFGGIGVRIRMEDNGVRVVEVMEGTPAERSGLLDDDLIIGIDGVPAPGMDQREVIRRLRGPVDSKVELTIQRDYRTQEIAVARAHIVPQTVRFERHDRIAYFKVTGFNQSTTQTLREKLRAARLEMGDDLKGYLLDLRGNPGGLLDQAWTVADLFMEGGDIVTTKGRHPESEQYFSSRSSDVSGGLPMVVLINGNSASASEIVAAALQDSGRAVVVGSTSYGKGTVQNVLRLPNDGELTLTWARFHAPSGYALQGRGVMPDVCTSSGGSSAGRRDILPGAYLVSKSVRLEQIAVNDNARLHSYRENCPTSEDENALDVEIAEQLLLDPTLFARAIERPNTAQGEQQFSALAD